MQRAVQRSDSFTRAPAKAPAKSPFRRGYVRLRDMWSVFRQQESCPSASEGYTPRTHLRNTQQVAQDSESFGPALPKLPCSRSCFRLQNLRTGVSPYGIFAAARARLASDHTRLWSMPSIIPRRGCLEPARARLASGQIRLQILRSIILYRRSSTAARARLACSSSHVRVQTLQPIFLYQGSSTAA